MDKVEKVARAISLAILKRQSERNDEVGGQSLWTLNNADSLKSYIDYDWINQVPLALSAIEAFVMPQQDPQEGMTSGSHDQPRGAA